jgi:hypothetical protein
MKLLNKPAKQTWRLQKNPMMNNLSKYRLGRLLAPVLMLCAGMTAFASSHREAPLIAYDPLADNTDVYAFVSPDNPNTVTIIACYVPAQLPHGGPNYYQFGKNVRYEIHIDNDPAQVGDEITYRFTFDIQNEDPSTFFNIRLGKQNLKTTYKVEKILPFGGIQTILTNGIVPPPNIGARSIGSPVGLNTTYQQLVANAIKTGANGEKIFCGTADDPFFVDLGGIFDLGDAPRQKGKPRDGLACYNVSAIAIQLPIKDVIKQGTFIDGSILNPNMVIGVWASASRQQIRTLGGGKESYNGQWIQVSRLGMPLTNEAVIPIGSKDRWNSLTPYQDLEATSFHNYFFNPELALYMDDALFGGAVPGFAPLRIQRKSLGQFDFGNGKNGLFPLKGSPALAGTALDDAVFGTLLLPGPGMPRSVDLFPIFYTGVPNLPPYQLATGKNGNPLAHGKPFIHNFLPSGGDMLRINLSVPPTPRNHPQFSSLGVVSAAVLGLTDPAYNKTAALQWIPNMDGFPNGRRLEDDVTRIELQAVSGVALAAIGLWYDDFVPGKSPLTKDLLDVLTYTTGVEKNDTDFRSTFPYVALPWAGDGKCSGTIADNATASVNLPQQAAAGVGVSVPDVVGKQFVMANFPNPFESKTTIRYEVAEEGNFSISVYDVSGKVVANLVNEPSSEGEYSVDFDASNLAPGIYFAKASNARGEILQVLKLVKNK